MRHVVARREPPHPTRFGHTFAKCALGTNGFYRGVSNLADLVGTALLPYYRRGSRLEALHREYARTGNTIAYFVATSLRNLQPARGAPGPGHGFRAPTHLAALVETNPLREPLVEWEVARSLLGRLLFQIAKVLREMLLLESVQGAKRDTDVMRVVERSRPNNARR